MKTTLLLSLLTFFAFAARADERFIAAVRVADDARVAATQAGDRAALAAIYSDDLHYGHSNGKVDNKASQLQGVISGPNRYDKIEYKERTFIPAGPGVVLMKGRALVHMTGKADGNKSMIDLNYLAVWREENGKWRFFAWQSCRNPAPVETKK
jgi:ketosteroid isomerase-like protein